MIDAILPPALALAIASCGSVATVALLRPVVRRYCGAAAVLRLWWIVPVALAATLIPKSSAPAWTGVVTIMQSVATVEIAQAKNTAIPWFEIALLLWLLGVLATSFWLYRGQRRFLRSVQWGSGRRGELPAQCGPAIVGAIRPRLALPADFRSRYSPLEQRLILLHETIHLRRRDGLANLAMSLLLVLQWFNPLLHWATRAMCRDQESACDALVIARHPQALRTYADALLKTLSQAASHQHLPLVCRWHAYHPIVERIAMLKSHRDLRVKTKLAAWLLLTGAVMASAIAYAARPAGDHAPPAENQSGDFYRISVSLAVARPDAANAGTVSRKSSKFDVVVRPGERFMSEMSGEFRFSISARPQADNIFIETRVESLVDGVTIAKPSMVVKPDEKGVIEIGQKAGADALMVDGFRLEISVHPYTREEAAAARATPRVSPRAVAGNGCRVDSVATAQALTALLPAQVKTRALNRDGDRIQMTGYADSSASVSTLMRRIEQSGNFSAPDLRSIRRVEVDGMPTNEFQLNFVAACNSAAKAS